MKTRVTLWTLLVVALGLWVMAWYASRVLREDMQNLVGEQQLSTVTVLANQVASELATRLQALERLAGKLGPVLKDTAAAQTLLEQEEQVALLFNRGVFAAGRDGVAIVSVPLSLQRVGIDYRDRDYMRAALEQGRTTVGRPVPGRPLGTPVLVMAAPVRDAGGRIIGAVAGVVDLGRPSFLDAITRTGYGETGAFHVVSRPDRLIVTSSDRSRVLQALPPPGANEVVDRVLSGYEGTVLMTNPLGVEVLNSGRHVAAAGWDIVASMPVKEAFAPIQRMQRRMLAAAATLIVLTGVLVWWVLRRQLAPTVAAARALTLHADDASPMQPLPVARDDEVGTLIAGFNRLLATLAQREAGFRVSDQALRSISEAVIITGPDHNVLSGNDAHETITGYGVDELLGRNLRLLQGPLTDRGSVEAMRTALAGHQPFRGELLNYRKDGVPFWNELTISPVFDTGGQLTHFVGITRDVTQRRQAQDQINQLAFYDVLTGLPNRRLLKDRLEQAMASSQRSGLYGAVVFIDLDNFKPLNDEHGHGVGDRLLAQAAQRLRSAVREADTVARFGGDEFVLVLDTLADSATASAVLARGVAEKVRQLLSEPYVLPTTAQGQPHEIEHHCTASMGVALFCGHGISAEELMRRADVAMYVAKDHGRGGIELDTVLA